MYGFIKADAKQYTEYLKCSNPAKDNAALQNQVSQKQNEDSDLSYDWNDDLDKSYVTNNIDDSPPTIEDLLAPYLSLSGRDLIDEFYEKMAVISKENYQDYRESKYENCTEVALKRLDCLVDEYLKKGIKLNLLKKDYEHTVSNLIFEELIKIADRVIEITPTTISRIDSSTGEDALNELTDTDCIDILISTVSKLLLE
ncbi:hypothetical protein [Candidatus Mesenet endosymbiont of Phosphuga atrata]|uniref:hypothetical protein n=1 Tax=Candidatus Mesenet endosymbiont of Phosphuga atrata TaxID=3066221 RepID=UPI0030D150A4